MSSTLESVYQRSENLYHQNYRKEIKNIKCKHKITNRIEPLKTKNIKFSSVGNISIVK